MTAPNYKDKNKVNGFTKVDIRSYTGDTEVEWVAELAKTSLLLWEERDKARETAALQDDAIHKALPRTHAMEKCVRVLRWFANANEENHMGHCFWCSAPLENFTTGHADPCGVVDAKKVLEELDKTKV